MVEIIQCLKCWTVFIGEGKERGQIRKQDKAGNVLPLYVGGDGLVLGGVSNT